MWRQLKQVAITYVTRPTPLTWIAILLAGVIYIFSLTLFVDPKDRGLHSLIFAILGGFFLGGILADQLRWQFIHSRSALLPGFRMPHVLAFGIVALAFALLTPLVATCLSNTSAWPVLCGLALGVAWSLRPVFANLVGIAVLLMVLFGDRVFDEQIIQSWMNAEGYRRLVWIGVTLLAWAVTIWQVSQLGALAEDDPYYNAPVVADANANVSRTFRMARQCADSAAAARNVRSSAWTSAWLDRQIRRAAKQRPWRRLALAFFEGKSPASPLASAIFPISFLLFIHCYDREVGFHWQWDAEKLRSAWFFVALAAAASALVPATRLAAHVPQMTAERLLPMSNRAYADALLGVCLWWTVRAWLVIQTVVAFAVFALPWEELDTPSVGDAAAYLAISLAGLIYSFGVGMFCSSMQGCFPVLFAAVTSALATLALQGYWVSLEPHDSQGAAMFWAVVFTVAGFWFAQRARLLWRHKELAAALATRQTARPM